MSQKSILIAIACLAVLTGAFAVWKLHAPTANQAALAQLQADMRGVTAHFLDASRSDRQTYTPAEQKIKDDLVAVFLAINPGNDKDYYSNGWIDAIGSRYILFTQPSGGGSYDETIDSRTGKATVIPGEARYYLAPTGRNIALYIDTQTIRTYTLDQADAVVVKGSQLSGTETYTSGEADNPGIIPRMSWTPDSITITIFDTSKRVPNPKLGVGATMNGTVREVTLSF